MRLLERGAHQQRGRLLKARPASLGLLAGLFERSGPSSLLDRFPCLALGPCSVRALCPFCVRPGVVWGGERTGSVDSSDSGGLTAVLRPREVLVELAPASWHRARAAVCLCWSQGSFPDPFWRRPPGAAGVGLRSGLLLAGALRLRFSGRSSWMAPVLGQLPLLAWRSFRTSLSWCLVERFRGAMSSPCSDGEALQSSETGVRISAFCSGGLREVEKKTCLF